MGDRSGGREVKGASLKKSKKNPGSTAAKAKTKVKDAASAPTQSSPTPFPTGTEPYFDCGSALISRQFDRDRDRVLQRGRSEGGCCAVVQWFSDIEKQQALADLSKSNAGFLYFVTGVHPDNVDRTNKKSHEGWLEKVEEIGRRPECVGVLTGLNLVRETGTHFAQESLLQSACRVADKLGLPLVLHVASDGASLDRAIELLRAEGWTKDEASQGEMTSAEAVSRRFMVHDAVSACAGDAARLKLAVDAGCMCMISAAGLAESDEAAKAKAQECIRIIPLEQLLVGSDSPWHTPQNLDDTYLRTLRNEPSNIAAIFAALSQTLEGTVSREELVIATKNNAIQFYGMESLTPDQLSAAAEASAFTGSAELSGASAAEEENKKASFPSDKKGSETLSIPTTVATSSFSCHRCRQRLFGPADVTTHGLDASKSTVFKIGDEGLCTASVFVAAGDPKELATRTGLQIRGGNVECSECGSKLGRFYDSEAICGCGAAVPGPTAKIAAAKVDFTDGSVDAETLALRSIREAEENEKQRELDDQGDQGGKVGKKKRGKMKGRDGKGNFSSFRNKSFIPNASRGGKKKDEDGEDNEDGEDSEGEEEEEVAKTSNPTPKSRFIAEESSSDDEN